MHFLRITEGFKEDGPFLHFGGNEEFVLLLVALAFWRNLFLLFECIINQSAPLAFVPRSVPSLGQFAIFAQEVPFPAPVHLDSEPVELCPVAHDSFYETRPSGTVRTWIDGLVAWW